jgi:hypothetical protein
VTYRDEVDGGPGSVPPANSNSLPGNDPARPAAVEGNDNHNYQLGRRAWRLGRAHSRVRLSLAEGSSLCLGQGSAICRTVRGPLMRSAARLRRCALASCSALCSKLGLLHPDWLVEPVRVWGNGGRVRRHLCCPVLSMPCQLKSLDQFKDTPLPRFQLGVPFPSRSLFLRLTT